MAAIAVELIQKRNSLEQGRQIINANDQALANGFDLLIAPAHVHTQSSGAIVWTINHGLKSEDILWRVSDSDNKKIEPSIQRIIDENTLELTFSSNTTGKCVIILGRATYVNPLDNEIGLPVDEIWGLVDGGNPAGLIATDALKTAIDKLNSVIAKIAPPPNVLQGNIVPLFPDGFEYKTGRISSGSGQNLNLLTAGQSYSKIVTTDAIELKTPASPANQFGRADVGVLRFVAGGSTVDEINLGNAFDEGFREEENGQPITGYYLTDTIVVNSIAKHLNVPSYQKGDFSVFLQNWLSVGESPALKVQHVIDDAEYNTAQLIVFYDDGPLPTVGTNSTDFIEVDEGDVKYLSGIKFYSTGATFQFNARIDDGCNRTFGEKVAQVRFPGMFSKQIAWNHSSVNFTKNVNYLNDTFDGVVIDTAKWTPSAGASQNDKITLTNDTSGIINSQALTLIPRLLKNTLFSIDVELNWESASGGGTLAGIKLEYETAGYVEFGVLIDDTNQTFIKAYYYADGGTRSQIGTFGPITTLLNTDIIHLSITTTMEDNDPNIYTHFRYKLNSAPNFTDITIYFVFNPEPDRNELLLQLSLFATNKYHATLPEFSYSFDNLVFSNGYASTVDSVPDINDSIYFLNSQFILNKVNENSIDANLTIIPLSPRGNGNQFTTSQHYYLVDTFASNRSTDLIEYFTDEQYRLPAGDYDLPPAQLTGNFDSSLELPLNYAQVYGGKLVYPQFAFNDGTFHPSQSFDYSGKAGNHHYFRAFLPVAPKSSGLLKIGGIEAANITNSQVLVDIKIPGITGWLSLNSYFEESTFTGIDTDGCLTSIEDIDSYCKLTFTFGGFTTGLPSDVNNGCIILRITLTANDFSPSYMQFMGWEGVEDTIPTSDVPDPEEIPTIAPLELTINAPVITTYEAQDLGGTLTADTYYYKVVGYDVEGNPTLPSDEVAVEVDGVTTNAVYLIWEGDPGIVQYRVYGRTSNSQDMYFLTESSEIVDSGLAGNAGLLTDSGGATSAYVRQTGAKFAGDVKITESLTFYNGLSGHNTITSSATDARSLTLPDANGEIVTDIAEQTLTNKTLAGDIPVTGHFQFQMQELALDADANDVPFSQGYLRITPSAEYSITGFVAKDGAILHLVNPTGQNINIREESVESIAENRILTGSGNVPIGLDKSMTLIYDNTSQRWRRIGGTA